MTLKRPVRDALRKRLAEAAVAKGADPKKVEAALAEMESERPLLEWLLHGGFELLLRLILELAAVL